MSAHSKEGIFFEQEYSYIRHEKQFGLTMENIIHCWAAELSVWCLRLKDNEQKMRQNRLKSDLMLYKLTQIGFLSVWIKWEPFSNFNSVYKEIMSKIIFNQVLEILEKLIGKSFSCASWESRLMWLVPNYEIYWITSFLKKNEVLKSFEELIKIYKK